MNNALRHGHTSKGRMSETYASWNNMISRCCRKKNAMYPRYGGRGIRVCRRWMVFDNFLKDMGEKPTGLSLDRIDNNDGYKPSNCRWATTGEQRINRDDVVWVNFRGRKRRLFDLVREIGVRSPKETRRNIARGWTVEEALLLPKKHGHKSDVGK